MGQANAQSQHRPFENEAFDFWRIYFIYPVLVVVAISVVLSFSACDMDVSRAVYQSQSLKWFDRAAEPWHFFYEFGPLPGIVIGVGGLIVCLVLNSFKRSGATSRAAAFAAILLIVGPGLIVNGGFKTWWGRPRPRQMTEFGGEYAFVPLGQPGNAGTNSSFPSGHASIGFYLMAPGFLFLRRRRKLAWTLLTTGFLFGALVGTARILQGGHFLSDVFWSGVVVYFTGVVLARAMKVDGLDLSDLRDLRLLFQPKKLLRRPVRMLTRPVMSGVSDIDNTTVQEYQRAA